MAASGNDLGWSFLLEVLFVCLKQTLWSLCGHGWLGTQYLDQNSLKLTEITPASASAP